MGLETATFISGLNANNPVGATDPKSQGDDHLRLIKTTLLNTFPNITGEVSATQAQINDLVSNIPRLNANNEFSALSPIIGTNADMRIRRNDTTGVLRLMAMPSINAADGARIELFGANHATQPGQIQLVAASGRDIELVGTNLQGNGAELLTASNYTSIVNHDSLLGFVTNEHINHASVAIIGGSGLTGGGNINVDRQLNVGQGDGINVTVDSVAVDSTVARTNVDETFQGSVTVQDQFAISGTITNTTTGTKNDVNTANAGVLRFTGAETVDWTLTGLTNGTAGRRLTVINLTPHDMTITAGSPSSAVNNRLREVSANPGARVKPKGAIDFVYDGASHLWQAVAAQETPI